MMMSAYKGKHKQMKGTAVRRFPFLPVLVAVDAAALIGLRPDLDGLLRGVAAPHAWVAAEGTDRVVVSVACAALWAVAIWLACGIAAAVASALPGTCGRAARAVAGRLLPTALYRVLAGAAGVGVVLAPVAATAQPTSPPPASAHAAPLPAPAWPTENPPPTEKPPPTENPPQPAVTLRPTAAPQPAEAVVVQPGDSLWRIAAQRLGPRASPARVATAWPRWYAANRATIGSDPDLIQVGQVLRAPAEEWS